MDNGGKPQQGRDEMTTETARRNLDAFRAMIEKHRAANPELASKAETLIEKAMKHSRFLNDIGTGPAVNADGSPCDGNIAHRILMGDIMIAGVKGTSDYPPFADQ